MPPIPPPGIGGTGEFLLRQLSHHRFCGDQEAGDRGCILKCAAHDFGRVNNALGHQVAVFAGLRVEAIGILVVFEDLADDDRAISAGVDRNLPGWGLDRLPHDLDAVLLVFIVGVQALQRLD